MSECYGNFFIVNGELTPSALFKNSDVYEGEAVYEVIRMINGLPLFFEDHISRLEQSVRHTGREMDLSPSTLARDLIRLKKEAGIREANLKIVLNYKRDNKLTALLYFIEPLYPTQQQYREGVRTVLYEAERRRPEIKLINHRLRSSIYHKLIAENAYEAILVNSSGEITEGSRSNLFFVKDETLHTAPDNMVLGGITRKHILELCGENNIEVVNKAVKREMVTHFDSLFMTGTSPMVLPVRYIDNIGYKVNNSLVNRVKTLYEERVKSNLTDFAKKWLKRSENG